MADILAQVADGLACAHAVSVVHRDVKPSNVLVEPSGRAVLVDFGLARGLDLPHITSSGHFLGTAFYAAPEQLVASPSGVGSSADVFSLGATLFEVLTLENWVV